MAVTVPEGRRRLTAFRLSDVPLAIRRQAARQLIRIAQESAQPFEAIMLTRAVEEPSATVYWVPTDAFETVRARRMWR